LGQNLQIRNVEGRGGVERVKNGRTKVSEDIGWWNRFGSLSAGGASLWLDDVMVG